jgi:hypothetical protein
MFTSSDFAANHPVVTIIFNFATIVFYMAIIWVFGRMGDNINKIRKMLEQELKKRQQS